MAKTKDNTAAVMRAIESAVSDALYECGMEAVTRAVDVCPVDTGTLRDSISFEENGTTLRVGSTVEYAPAVEFGTHKQKAQPYLTPALTKNTKEYQDIFAKHLKRIK